MRAKEILELRKKDMHYYDLVHKAIIDLYPLRCERRKTEDYFNRYLFADMRCHVEKDFVLREGEVDPRDAFLVRLDILHVIERDDSFIYAYNIIAQSRNIYWQTDLLALCRPKRENNGTPARIRRLCAEFMEDYPKTQLSDYLLDEHNLRFYNRKNTELGRDPQWWLEAFNLAYRLFDEMRVRIHDPFEAGKLAMEPFTDDEELRHTVLDIVRCLLKRCCLHLNFRQKIEMVLLHEEVSRYYNSGNHPATLAQQNEELRSQVEALKKELRSQTEALKEEQRSQTEALKEELKKKDEIIANQNQTIEHLKKEIEKRDDDVGAGLTVNQLALVFYYMFDAMSLNFANSDKTQWARFIHQVTGKSYHRIRNALSIDFDSKTTRKNLRVVAPLFEELFPQIHKKILNDMQSLE